MIERLKKEKLIEKIFRDGKSIFVFPIKAVFLALDDMDNKSSLYVGVSVGKRNFKKAVDRNRIKRQIRASIWNVCTTEKIIYEKNVAIMLMYIAKEKLEFSTIDKSVKNIFSRLKKTLAK